MVGFFLLGQSSSHLDVKINVTRVFVGNVDAICSDKLSLIKKKRKSKKQKKLGKRLHREHVSGSSVITN